MIILDDEQKPVSTRALLNIVKFPARTTLARKRRTVRDNAEPFQIPPLETVGDLFRAIFSVINEAPLKRVGEILFIAFMFALLFIILPFIFG